MGRLNAIVIRRGKPPHVHRVHSRRRVRHSLREGSPGSGGWRVVYSVKLSHLERGDVIAAAARARTGIGLLPYSAYVASELVIAGRRTSIHPFRHDVTLDGFLTEAKRRIRLLAEAFRKQYFELPLFNHELKQIIGRVNLVVAVMPELELELIL